MRGIIAPMKAFRRLAAFLGCLAALSAILPMTAFGWTKVADAASASVTVSHSCPNCHDCDPCKASDANCSPICVSPVPTLGAIGPALPVREPGTVDVLSRLVVLDGLSPPPDPFPPRS